MDEIISILNERREQLKKDIKYTYQHKDIDTVKYDEICDMLETIDDIYFNLKCKINAIKEG